MTAARITPQDAYDIGTVDGGELEQEFRRVNAARRSGAGVLWFLSGGDAPDAPLLIGGVRGDVGCLTWEADGRLFRPRQGNNPGRVPYYTYDGHDFEQDAGVEVPIDDVYAAVREFSSTVRRPECVGWIEVDGER